MKHKIIKNIALLTLATIFSTAGYVTLFYTFTPLPSIETEHIASKQSTILLDRNGEFLFDFSVNERRTFIPYEEISENIINATIAIEDHLFFEHDGIRLDAFIRALVNNVRTLSFSQGGSTITQQVIKNIFLTSEKKIERKMKEFLLAIKLEKELDKEGILEMYLNTISYGGVSYGIAESSKSFFGKKPSELTIAESAYLASIPKAPTYYSPYGQNRKALEERKNHTLQMMLKHNLITREQYQQAKNESVHFQDQNMFSINAPHFVFFVKEQLEKEYGTGLKQLEGKEIKTTIDIKMQNEIEELMKEFSLSLEEKFDATNIASVVLEAQTGNILSMVGSRGFFDNKTDGKVNIITSLRQPGSVFKPIVYAEAFKKGLRPETVVYDVPTQFTASCDENQFETTQSGCYSPVNYTDKFSGPISLRNALGQSVNIPAVKVLYLANIEDVIQLAKKMGVTSITQDKHHYGLSLALGGAEITPLEIAQAYSVFANEGVLIPATWKMDEQEKQRKQVLPKHVAQSITDILTDDNARAPVFGRNSNLNITSPPVAVKTGTTNNARDIWIVGYSPNIVVLIWAGNSDNTPLSNNAAGFFMGPLFKEVVMTVSERYKGEKKYFSKNTQPIPESGPDIIYGMVDVEDPHTILHYIQKEKPTKRKKESSKDDHQYENWEYGVQKWIEENSIFNNQTRSDELLIMQNFDIESPRHEIHMDEITTIISTVIPIENIRYEFYVNNTLIGSSHLHMISFNPKTVIDENDPEVSVKVIANTPQGTYVAERNYRIRN